MLYLVACVICFTARLSVQQDQVQGKEKNNRDNVVVMQQTTFLEHQKEGWFEQGCS